ncbi:MAG: hypothetical protein C0513_05095 [Isosphaera sp.]|nr:hypothetical protein [Isosphaera sp.]
MNTPSSSNSPTGSLHETERPVHGAGCRGACGSRLTAWVLGAVVLLVAATLGRSELLGSGAGAAPLRPGFAQHDAPTLTPEATLRATAGGLPLLWSMWQVPMPRVEGISADIWVSSNFGLYETAGPMRYDLDPGLLARHRDKCAADARQRVPVNGGARYAVIDYEHWWPVWENNTPQVRAAWRRHVDTHRAQAVRGLTGDARERAYESAWTSINRRFWRATFEGARLGNPRALWGIYAQPQRSFWVWGNRPAADEFVERSVDRLAWLWEMTDAIYPSIYVFYPSVGAGVRPGPGYVDRAAQSRYLSESLRAAGRAASLSSRGRLPVVPLVMPVYHESNRRVWAGTDFAGLSSADWGLVLSACAAGGADGLCLWLGGGRTEQALRWWSRTGLPAYAAQRGPAPSGKAPAR